MEVYYVSNKPGDRIQPNETQELKETETAIMHLRWKSFFKSFFIGVIGELMALLNFYWA